MSLLDQLAEQHISRAMEAGQLSGLPGEAQPLALDDDRLVPAELRAGFRLLKNAGYLPPTVRLLSELRSVEQLLAQTLEPGTRREHRKRAAWLRLQLGEARGSRVAALLEQRR